jgi:DNA helicase-2/ATP-dependent DNA helicase PcrA
LAKKTTSEAAKLSRKDYNQRFEDTLKTLNPQQRQAVEQTDGVVMAIAGPGTGKTHILAARVGMILRQTDTAAQNVLCLTFTDAGVQAMRERLLQLIGTEAHNVGIFTFHSFCSRIIQENLEIFGRGDLEPLSELERVQLLRKMLDSLDPLHVLRRAHNAYQHLDQLKELFKLMKTEGWTVEDIEIKTQLYLDDIPNNPDFFYKNSRKNTYQTGEIKQEKVEDTQKKMELLVESARLFPKFERLLREEGRYDFDDMVSWVVKAFRQHPFLLRQYQERYLYLLVDEFQDTNGSQSDLLAQLLNFWDVPNVFIVGDDDQAIFEFQGARLRNIVDFYEQHQTNLSLIVLSENYRSTQAILDGAGIVIQQNELRLINALGQSLSKNLVARGSNAALQNPIKVVEYASQTHELFDVVAQIKALSDSGVPLSACAVLYRQHRQAARLVEILEKQQIHYHLKRAVNILDTLLMQQLRTLLIFLQKEAEQPESGEKLLFELLHFSFFNISSRDIQLAAMYISRENQRILTREEHELNPNSKGEKLLTWHELVFNLKQQTALLPTIEVEKWENLANILGGGIKNVFNLPIAKLIERMLTESGMMAQAMNAENRIWLIQILHSFMEFVKSEIAKNNRFSLKNLLEALDALDKHNIRLDLQKIGAYAETNGINLLTAHAAKGLEFEYVFVIDCLKNEWESKKSPTRHFALPPTLTYTRSEDETEAQRRLFYVALTRAKTNLQISYATYNQEGKKLEASKFLYELLESEVATLEKRHVEPDFFVENQVVLLQESPTIEIVEADFLNHWFAHFQLSISALNSYLKCPISFYYENVLRVPSVMTSAANFGMAAHYALQRAFLEMKRMKNNEFPDVDHFLHYFERAMMKHQSSFSPADYERKLAQGKKYLKEFYEKNVPTWNKDALVERGRPTDFNGIPLKGTIDKIEFFKDGTAHIVDYKTGRYDKNDFTPLKESSKNGKYRRQLIFYKILYEAMNKNLVRVRSGEIQYLEPNFNGDFLNVKIDFDGQEVLLMTQLIEKMWSKISKFEFSTGCGEKNCAWCNFVKTHVLSHSLSNLDRESMDDE